MRSLSGIQKIFAVVILVAVLGGVYAFWQAFGETIIGITIDSNPDLREGLVLHYTFDGPDLDLSQTTAEIRDQSGGALHGDWQNIRGTTTASGRIGQALSFTGFADSVSTGDNANIDFTDTEDFTIALWVKPISSTTEALVSSVNSSVYSTPGYASWTAPAGITSADVACWGAGGGGADNVNNGGGGGGGGAFASSTVAVTPSTQYTIFIGSGGLGPAAATQPGGIGGTSTFATTTVVAQGGRGGGTTAAGAGGLASQSTGTTKYNGGTGGTPNTNGDTGGGGGGSASPQGAGGTGSNGVLFGEGGAGGSAGTGGGGGGAGVNGTYTSASDGTSNVKGGGGGGGGDNGTRGGNGGDPGGGGGGAELNQTTGHGDGGDGQCIVSYITYATSTVATTSTSTLLSKSGGTGGGYKLYVEADGDLCFALDDDSTWGPEDSVCTTGTNFYTTNSWHNVMVQKDGTTGLYLYVDNPYTPVAQDLTITTGDLSNNQALYLGDDVQGTYSPVTGGIDDLRIYNRLLTEDQRSRLYDLGNTTRIAGTIRNAYYEQGLIGYWSFDGGVLTSTIAENLATTTIVGGYSASVNAENAESIQNGTNDDDWFGYSVSSAGDVNNDGYDDILVGAYFAEDTGTDRGRAYLFLGPITGAVNAENADAIFNGTNDTDRFGTSASSAGDVNGDGYDDVLVGSTQASDAGTSRGRAYLFLGPVTGSIDAENADAIFNGTSDGDNFASSISNAGDVNGDGHDDILVGAQFAEDTGTDSGRAYLFLGPLTGAVNAEDATAIFNGTNDNDFFGYSVSSGDVNGDGYDDVLVATYTAEDTGTDRGRAYLFLGPLSGAIDAENADAIFNGTNDGDSFGDSVSSGDVNNDGYDDILVGAHQASDAGTSRGRAYLFLGPVTGSIDAENADAIFNGTSDDDLFAWAASSGGDVNNDGNDDILVNARWASDTGTLRGRVYLFLGPVTGSIDAENADAVFNGTNDYDTFGDFISFAGDVNADGYDDILTSSTGASDTGTERGRAYLFLTPRSYPKFSATSSTNLTPTPGRLGQALEFNGTSDYASVGDMTSAGGIRSISFWIRPDDNTSRGILKLSDTARVEFDSAGNATTTGSGWTSPTIYVNAVQGIAVTQNDWSHITIVNGADITTATNTVFGLVTGSYFDGKLDDIRFYNRALTQDDINRISGLGNTTRIGVNPPKTSADNGLTGHWTFNGPTVSATVVEDQSGNSYDGRIAPSSGSTQAFTSSGTFNVPAGVTSITVKAWGAGGGASYSPTAEMYGRDGGGGGFMKGTLSVTPSESLAVTVGAGGGGSSCGGAVGGGYSGVFRGSAPLLIAGAGGGAGHSKIMSSCSESVVRVPSGGPGGGDVGTPGVTGLCSSPAAGGTQTAGGAGATGCTTTDGSSGSYLSGGNPGGVYGSGGGGAGYYGGGGGGYTSTGALTYTSTSGAGGSSWATSTATATSTESGSGWVPGGTSDPDYPGSNKAYGGNGYNSTCGTCRNNLFTPFARLFIKIAHAETFDEDGNPGYVHISWGGGATVDPNADFSPTTGIIGQGANFFGDGKHIDVGTTSTDVKTLAVWVRTSSSTQYLLDLNGSAYLSLSAGTVTATGFTSPTVYVDGVQTTTLPSDGDWHHIAVTTNTSVNASDMDIGRVEGLGSYTGKMDDVRTYNRALTASEILRLYQQAN